MGILNNRCVVFFYLVLTLFFSPSVFAENSYKVKSTDSLNTIVNKFYKDSGLRRHQLFIAILAENPKAFRLGNINFLKAKQELSLPDSNDLLILNRKEANTIVAEHNDHAKKRKKTQLPPPFNNSQSEDVSDAVADIAERQQVTNQELERLNAETEDLKRRLEELTSDKNAMDSELKQLDELLSTK